VIVPSTFLRQATWICVIREIRLHDTGKRSPESST
jgi:hypothetical protein